MEKYKPKVLTLNVNFSGNILVIHKREDWRGKQVKGELYRQFPHLFESDTMMKKFRLVLRRAR